MAFSIDLRSDTVTRPSAAMRRAMLEAEVGDDVIDIDPTVERLQEIAAELLGKPAALFMPSGTMANQIALRLHCRPGDEFLCDSECHIIHYEQGAYAQLSGLVAHGVVGQHGILHLEQLVDLVRPPADHTLSTRLVCLENTHNRGGGTIQPLANIRAICTWAHQQGLATHCDGARLMNAVVATGIPAARWSECFDSVSLCFSKGLGAPVGSVLAGSKEFIQQARRARKLFGGGMRQVGILAAAAIYALDHNVARLADDHVHAQLLGQAISQIPGLALQNAHIETNMVIFQIDPAWGTAAAFAARLAELDVGAFPFGPQSIRLVTHLDVGRQQVLDAIEIIRRVATEKR